MCVFVCELVLIICIFLNEVSKCWCMYIIYMFVSFVYMYTYANEGSKLFTTVPSGTAVLTEVNKSLFLPYSGSL